MPRALSESVRQDIWLLWQRGQSADSIARELSLTGRTVYRLLASFRQAAAALPPDYHHCGRSRSTDHNHLAEKVLHLRRLHPGWGAGRILAQLSLSHAHQLLPDRSTVKRWLAAAGLAPVRCRPNRPPAPRASRAHEMWQMDACEMILLADGSRSCWLRLVDEASSAALLTRVFPHARWTAVGKQAVQSVLRDGFARWGRPEGIRVDRGIPWVSSGGLPSDLELWLAGLEVPLHINRVRCPQDNAEIESSNRTGKLWSGPQQCASAEQLQKRIDEEDQVQRERYRGDDGLTRWERDPDLLHSGRGYVQLWEKYGWDLPAALACLAAHRVSRKVSKCGQVSLYDHHHRLGQSHAGQVVEVSFDADSGEWCFAVGQEEVARSAAYQITQEGIVGLQLGSRPGRSAQETAKRKGAAALATPAP
jgi:transposase InsO family protein